MGEGHPRTEVFTDRFTPLPPELLQSIDVIWSFLPPSPSSLKFNFFLFFSTNVRLAGVNLFEILET